MTIVVVGGGAIGLLVAGRLMSSAQQVALLARPDIVETLRAQPITLAQRNQVRSVPAPVVAAEPAELPPDYLQPDLAVLCVKSYDTESALATLTSLDPWQILTLQNGIGNEETLVRQFGPAHLLSGAITSSVQIEAPGHIRVTKEGGIGLASVGDRQRNRLWGAVLGKAGFRVREYPDYRALKWSKALLNMLGNATPAILDMPIDAVYADSRLIALEQRAFLEALMVMRHLGLRPVNLPAYPVALLAQGMRTFPPAVMFPLLRRLIAGGRGGKLPSLHIDLRRGRPTSEGAYLYGAVARTARDHGLAAPVNDTLWHALQSIASGTTAWDSFRQQPEKLLALVEYIAHTPEDMPAGKELP